MKGLDQVISKVSFSYALLELRHEDHNKIKSNSFL